jgi:two-component system, LuxR family, response regulator FixJ
MNDTETKIRGAGARTRRPASAPSTAEGLVIGADATVFIIDDDRAMADAMVALLQLEGFRAKAYYRASDFLAEYDELIPGCVVTDVRLPDMSGVELQSTLRERRFAPPMVLITGHADVPTAVKAMAAGAVDFIEKPFSDEALLGSVRRALVIDAARREEVDIAETVAARRALLTPQELKVYELLVAGRQNKEVAYLMSISPRTVEKYRAWVMSKMQAKNIADLVRMSLLAPPG